MAKIGKINSTKNLQDFPKLFNNKDSDKSYSIDTERNVDAFERQFSNDVLLEPACYSDYDVDMFGVPFENTQDFNVVEISKTEDEGKTIIVYKTSGSTKTMTEEQVGAYGDAAVAGETQYVSIAYSSNFKNATQKQTGWVATADAEIVPDRPKRELSPNGIESTALGVSGPGTTNAGNPYYKSYILDANDNILVEHVFDLTDFIGVEQ